MVYTIFNHTHLVQAASYNWSTSIYHHLAKSRPCSHFGALVMLASMTVDCWHPRPRGRKWDIRSIMGYPKSIEHPLKNPWKYHHIPHWMAILRGIPQFQTLIGNHYHRRESEWWFGTFFISPIVGMMIQSDELIFFRGVAQPPIRSPMNRWNKFLIPACGWIV